MPLKQQKTMKNTLFFMVFYLAAFSSAIMADCLGIFSNFPILQEKRLQELLSSPPPVLEGVIFVRRLLENQSIYQLTASENLTLIEGCRAIDPDFFVWLKDKQIKIPPRHIVYCVLIRMRKTKKEILSIFDISDGACRAMRSRVRASLGIEDEDMETFLQELH